MSSVCSANWGPRVTSGRVPVELHRIGDDPALHSIDVNHGKEYPVRLELFVDHDFQRALGRGPGTLEGL